MLKSVHSWIFVHLCGHSLCASNISWNTERFMLLTSKSVISRSLLCQAIIRKRTSFLITVSVPSGDIINLHSQNGGFRGCLINYQQLYEDESYGHDKRGVAADIIKIFAKFPLFWGQNAKIVSITADNPSSEILLTNEKTIGRPH